MTPFITQLWFFLSPIAYSGSLIPERWQFLYGLNPMVGNIDGIRWVLVGRCIGFQSGWLFSANVSAAILVRGLTYFRRTERDRADVV